MRITAISKITAISGVIETVRDKEEVRGRQIIRYDLVWQWFETYTVYRVSRDYSNTNYDSTLKGRARRATYINKLKMSQFLNSTF